METDNAFLTLVVVVLTWSVALNLFLTLRIAAVIRPEAEPDDKPLTVPIGLPLPDFRGWRELDHKPVSLEDLSGRASLILFLSPGCSTCREAVPQIRRILPGIKEAQVLLWIVTGGSAGRSAELLRDLMSYRLQLDGADLRRLNPRNASPFYIMIDDRVVQASNFIGDEDWQTFVEQMEAMPALTPH